MYAARDRAKFFTDCVQHMSRSLSEVVRFIEVYRQHGKVYLRKNKIYASERLIWYWDNFSQKKLANVGWIKKLDNHTD